MKDARQATKEFEQLITQINGLLKKWDAAPDSQYVEIDRQHAGLMTRFTLLVLDNNDTHVLTQQEISGFYANLLKVHQNWGHDISDLALVEVGEG